jgi:acyl-CoA dehydrogenase
VLKHYDNQGRRPEDLPIVEWACRSLLSKAQDQLHGFLRNFPNRTLAALMRFFIFPRGLQYSAPDDRLGRTLAELVLSPGEVRDRLCYPVYRKVTPNNPLGLLQEVLEMAERAEGLEKRIRVDGVKTGRIRSLEMPGMIAEAQVLGIITGADAAWLAEYDRKVMEIVNVDDFAPHELGTHGAALARLPRASDEQDERVELPA